MLVQAVNSEYIKREKNITDNENIVSEKEIVKGKVGHTAINNDYIGEEADNAFLNIINAFITNCNNGKTQEAYEMLSADCKDIIYPTVDEFVQKYYNNIFTENKTYEAELWIESQGICTYRITFLGDLLSTGGTNALAIEDYYTIVKEDGKYKLNISNFVKREEINKATENVKITVAVLSKNVYIDNIEYNLKIKNNTSKEIMLDSRESSKKVYLQDSNEVKYVSYLYEMLDKDLRLLAGETKEVSIKFARSYKKGIKDKQIVFSDILLDYRGYRKNNASERLEVKIDL